MGTWIAGFLCKCGHKNENACNIDWIKYFDTKCEKCGESLKNQLPKEKENGST